MYVTVSGQSALVIVPESAADCSCNACSLICLTDEDLEWLDEYSSWRPEYDDILCVRRPR